MDYPFIEAISIAVVVSLSVRDATAVSHVETKIPRKPPPVILLGKETRLSIDSALNDVLRHSG
jgi:hypothetical protein